MIWKSAAVAIGTLVFSSAIHASEFRHVGDFLLKAHFKITGGEMTPIPMKPIAFKVYTNGVSVRVATEDDQESFATFEIYRSDGISRQRTEGGAIEIIPGIQATSRTDGVLRHLRLSAESLTITTFPGVSNQTIVSYSVAAEPVDKTPKTGDTPSKQP
jgi:hypothetical protein